MHGLIAHMDGMCLGGRDRPALLQGKARPQRTRTILRDGGSPGVMRAALVAEAEEVAEALVDTQEESTGTASTVAVRSRAEVKG